MTGEERAPTRRDDGSWRCPRCGSGADEHRVERDGPESLEVIVCQRCGARWAPRP
jgi:DNA-directed RNA polymerase subunit RPC12/RpoP